MIPPDSGADATARFAHLSALPAAELATRLDEAALLMAAHARPGLDVGSYRSRLDDLAASCRRPVLAEVAHTLFVAQGFRGNEAEYHDPRNSYLDAVLDRRLGIPITLSVVLMEVARRLGIPLAGVGMPRHFLVRLDGEPLVLIDAFEGGRLLSPGECQARFEASAGPGETFDPRYLEPVGPHAILARMLANLRHVHAARRDSRAVEWVLRLRGLLPGVSVEERSERAGVLVALARFGEAAAVLEGLAEEAPDARAAQLTAQAKRIRARLN